MKKARIFTAAILLVVFLCTLTSVGLAKSNCSDPAVNVPVVAVMVVNDARTTFDAEISQKVTERITNKFTGIYLSVPGDAALVKVANAGIGDIATAKAEDVASVLRESGIDYAVYIQVDPFVRKERWSVFTHSMNMIAVVPFKIIDVKTGKYLYSGRSVESATATTFVMLGLTNKLTCLEALDKALDNIIPIAYGVLPLRQ